jgi:hypothetical protein
MVSLLRSTVAAVAVGGLRPEMGGNSFGSHDAEAGAGAVEMWDR